MLVPEPEVEPEIELEVGGTVEEVENPGTEFEFAEVVGTVVVVATVFDVIGDVEDGVIDGDAVVAVDETWEVVVLPKHCADKG